MGDSQAADSKAKCDIKCEPLRTLTQLASWRVDCASCLPPTLDLVQHEFVAGEDAGKVLLCHDMKGGYLEDDRQVAKSTTSVLFPGLRAFARAFAISCFALC